MNQYAPFLVLLFSITAFGQISSYEKQVDGLFNKGYEHLYVTKDSAYYYFKKIEDLAIENNDWKTVFEALMSANRTAGTFYDFGKLSHNLKVLDSLILIHKSYLDSLPKKKVYINSLLYDKANYYYKIGSFDKAKNHFRKILDSYKGQDAKTMLSEHFDLLSVSLSFMAKIYELEEKYDLAYDYYTRNIDLIKQVNPNNHDDLFINYALLAEVLRQRGDLNSANSYLRLTLRDALEQNNNPNRIVSVCYNLAENQLILNQSDSTLYYLSLMKKHLYKSPYFGHLYYRAKAKVAQQEGKLKNAVAEMDNALLSYLAYPEQLDGTSLANIYLEKAHFLMANGNFKETLDLTNKALDTLKSRFGPIYLKLMSLKTASLVRLEDFNAADVVAHSAVVSLDSLKPDYQYSSDKMNLVENTYPLFETALEANYALYEKTNNPRYLEKAFFYMEKSKSVLLMEAIRSTNANKFIFVPESLLEKERVLRTEITAIEKEVKALKYDDVGLRNQIFDLRKQQSELIDSITVNYPKYHQLRYESNVTNLENILKGLVNDQILISYFYGDQAIYAISVGHRAKTFKRIENAKVLEDQIANFYGVLSNPRSDLKELRQMSQTLYTKILDPVLLPKTKKVIIIPDGSLNYLAFDALIDPQEPENYVVEKFPVSYTNSATLLTQLWVGEKHNENVLAFAPRFRSESINPSESRDILSPLPHNTSEVQQIMSNFDGQAFLGEEATLANFRKNVGSYGILHFATHAIFNNEQPEFSYMAFSPSKEAQLLYVKDLYNLELHANMVTLSACETALGELKRGEGFIGLARGFFYAGAKSLTSTLWKVNDATTSKLMADYYQGMALGETKAIALQKAKLTFLNSNKDNALAHPYYWSGFILSGNYAPLHADWPWVYIALPIMLIATLIFVLKFGKKTNPTP